MKTLVLIALVIVGLYGYAATLKPAAAATAPADEPVLLIDCGTLVGTGKLRARIDGEWYRATISCGKEV